MLTVLILILFAVVVVGLITRMARASRRAREEEQRRLEELLRSDGGDETSPSVPFPFGGMLDELMRGMETRSYGVDPETGEWVEITRERPAAPEPRAQPPRAKR